MRTVDIYEYSELDKVAKYKAFTDHLFNKKQSEGSISQAEFGAIANGDKMEFTATGRRF